MIFSSHFCIYFTPASSLDLIRLTHAWICFNRSLSLLSAIFSLYLSMPAAFSADWLRSLIGLIVILAVSLHVSLSWADVKGSLSALPVYLTMLALFALATSIAGLSHSIVASLRLLNLRVLSIFCIIIAFAALWVAIALVIRIVRTLIRAF